MRILVADPDPTHRQRACERLAALSGVTLAGHCADLTQTFDAVEHRPPTLALIAPDLVRRPEFEMMEMLFRTLSVKWMLLRASRGPGTTPDRAVIDLDADDARLLAALSACVANANVPPPRAATGLLSAVDGGRSSALVLIGSSTGGIDALLRILGSFPVDCPPTLIVQHTGAAHSAGLARLLDRNVAPNVREAEDGEAPARGSVLLAPGADKHLVVAHTAGLACKLVDGPRVSGHRPSVDALFASAVPIARRVTAAILTGMGRDGAEGMLALRHAGACTLGQDRATSVVWGMPGQAVELGAVTQEHPLGAMGPAILRAAQRRAG